VGLLGVILIGGCTILVRYTMGGLDNSSSNNGYAYGDAAGF
jgi:hypothetical protein